jgi:hypothetical protein
MRAGRAFLKSQDLLGHRGGERLPPAGPRQRLVVEHEKRTGRVRLKAARVHLRLDVQGDPLVAEADPEVLKAPVAAAGLRQHVVELVRAHGGYMTARGPQARFAAPPAVIVVKHPPARDRIAQIHCACGDGASFEVVLLAVDVL